MALRRAPSSILSHLRLQLLQQKPTVWPSNSAVGPPSASSPLMTQSVGALVAAAPSAEGDMVSDEPSTAGATEVSDVGSGAGDADVSGELAGQVDTGAMTSVPGDGTGTSLRNLYRL